MISITPGSRLYIAITPINFRKGIDGIARECFEVFSQDPLSGAYFAFRNRAENSFKIIHYDGFGYWLHHFRLSSGRLQGWPRSEEEAKAMGVERFMALIWHLKVAPQSLAPWQPLPILGVV
jgi:transposase